MGVVLLAKNHGNCGKMNQRIEKAKQSWNLSNEIWYNFMEVVDETVILAFIGLMDLRGLAGMCNYDVKYLYNALMGPQPFGAIMNKNRFQFLYACISVDLMIFLLVKHDGSTKGLLQ